MGTTLGKTSADLRLVCNHQVNTHMVIRHGITKHLNQELDAVRPWGKLRGAGAGMIGGEKFVRSRQIALVPDFLNHPGHDFFILLNCHGLISSVARWGDNRRAGPELVVFSCAIAKDGSLA